MRVAVRGSGRVGGYSGAPLANVGEDVFVARGTPGEAMRRRGLTLRTAAGESTVPVTAVPDTRSVRAPAVGGAVGNAITPLANLTRLVIAAGGDVS
jgi:ketopantoate reductase